MKACQLREAVSSRAVLKGIRKIVHRNGKGEILHSEISENVFTDEGLNVILDFITNRGSPATLYCVSYEGASPTTDSTYAIPVYTEITTIDDATRPEFVDNAAVSESVDNVGNETVFTYSATKTVVGVALVGGGSDGNTKGDTAGGGWMICAGDFVAARDVVADDTITMDYTLTMTDT